MTSIASAMPTSTPPLTMTVPKAMSPMVTKTVTETTPATAETTTAEAVATTATRDILFGKNMLLFPEYIQNEKGFVLDEIEKQELSNILKDASKGAKYHVLDESSSPNESYNWLGNKYVTKGRHYSKKTYVGHRGTQRFHWNENKDDQIQHSPNKRTTQRGKRKFRHTLLDRWILSTKKQKTE